MISFSTEPVEVQLPFSNPTVTARSRLLPQPDPGSGIGGYALDSRIDRVFPFDFDSDGKNDLFIYRPGRGAVWICGQMVAVIFGSVCSSR